MRRSLLVWGALACVCTAGAEDMPATCYVQDGLVAHFDGLCNAQDGNGNLVHSSDGSTWIDIVSRTAVPVATDGAPTVGDDHYAFSDKQRFEREVPGFCQAVTNSGFSTIEYTSQYTTLKDLGVAALAGNIGFYYQSGKLTFTQAAGQCGNWQTVAANTYVSASVVHPTSCDVSGVLTYFNGALNAGTRSVTWTAAYRRTDVLSVGNRSGGTHTAVGKIRCARFYSRKLSSDEIAYNRAIDRMRFEGATSNDTGYAWSGSEILVRGRVSAGDSGTAKITAGAREIASDTDVWLPTGAAVTFAATPDAGCRFVRWTGSTNGFTAAQCVSPTLALALDRPRTLTAVFHRLATCYWRGTNTLASVAGNWRNSDGEECVPQTGDAIVLDQPAKDLQWNLNDVKLASWTQDGFDGKVTFLTGSANYSKNRGCLSPDGLYRELCVTGDVMIASGWWTHVKNSTVSWTKKEPEYLRSEGYCRLVARIGGNIDIAVNGAINVSSNSFSAWQGPDGENGGAGGLGSSYWGPGSDTKTFGLIKTPRMIGSNNQGGGSAELHVCGTVTVDGTIQANGLPGDCNMGAGGSVWITAKALRGASTGVIMANAGVSTAGGGGAGGRISVQLTGEDEDFSQYRGKMETRSYKMSYSGTIYWEKASDNGKGELRLIGFGGTDSHAYGATVRAGGTPMATTNLEDSTFSNVFISNNVRAVVMSGTTCRTDRVTMCGNWNYQWVVLKGGTLQISDDWTPTNGQLRVFYANSTLRLGENGDKTLYLTNSANCVATWDRNCTIEGNVHVLSSGKLTHLANGSSDASFRLNPHITGDLTVDAGGLVSVAGCGYSAKYGPGTPTDADHLSRGGTHGGRAWDNAGIATYGSVRSPVTLGSGGYGQAGGGAMHLTVDGALCINGTVSADGTGGGNAGAGGSIWIEAGSLSGAGEIHANGGNGSNAVNAGGGGRVAVTLTDPDADFASYTGSILARAGLYSSKSSGACGTVYLRTAAEGATAGLLKIDSGDAAFAHLNPTEISTSVTDTEVGRVLVTNSAALQMLKSCTLTVHGDFASATTNTLPLGEISDGTLAGGAVIFTNADLVSHVTGTNRFADLTVATPGKRLEFGTAGSCASVVAGGNFNVQGADGNPVLLRSVTDGAFWPFALEDGASASIVYADVKDSDARGGVKVSVDDTSIDSGHNENWAFNHITPGMTISWNGSKSGVWSDPDNWDLGRVPVDTDAIVIGDTSSAVPTLTAALVANRLTVAAGATLDLAGYDLTVTNALAVAGTLDASAGSPTLTLGGDVTFGAASSFVCGVSTVVLAGEAKQTADFAGATLYAVVAANDVDFIAAFSANDFSCTASAARSLQFASGASYTFANLTLATIGSAAEPLLTVFASVPGSPWQVTVTAKADIRNTAVGDTAAVGCQLYPELPSTDLGGNNANVIFGTSSSRWIGGSSQKNWNDAANWSGGVPTDVTRAFFDTAATISLGTGGVARAIEIDAGPGTNVTLVGASPLNVAGTLELVSGKLTQQDGGLIAVKGNVYLRSGTELTHPRNTYEDLTTVSPDVGYRVNLSVGGDMLVESGASINVNGKGYAGNYKNTAGPGSQPGASHGARMGPSSKPAYGSIFKPDTLGSGATYGADGGGRVRLSVKGTLTVNGTVDAGGLLAPQSPGAGGSIWIDCGTLLGAGQIDAEGGWFNDYYNPGCGGRVAVYQAVATNFSAFAGKILANGGGYNRTGNLPDSPAGTVYLQSAGQRDCGGTLVIDNLGGGSVWQTGYADLPIRVQCADRERDYRKMTVDLKRGGKIGLIADAEIAELEMDSSSKLYLNGHALTIRSRKHRDKTKTDALGNNLGDWSGTVDYSTNGSTIIWAPRPTRVFVY